MSSNKIYRLVDSYYKPYSKNYLEKLFYDISSADSNRKSEKIFKKNEDYINGLKSKFKQLVLERNNLAKSKGNDNYFDFIAEWDGVPKQDIINFFAKAGDLSRKLLDELPFDNSKIDWFSSNYNNFNFELQLGKPKYKLPKEVVDFIKKNPSKNKYLKKIKLNPVEDTTFTTDYDYKKGEATINYDKNNSRLHDALSMAHEFGHAIGMVRNYAEGKETSQPKPFPDETRAVKFELEFLAAQKADIRKVAQAGSIYYFVNTLFEEKIYKDPEVDFDEVYANTHNVISPLIKQKSNPLYVLNSFLIEYPCYSTNYSVIYSKLLSQYAFKRNLG